jgi:hypothetical protein
MVIFSCFCSSTRKPRFLSRCPALRRRASASVTCQDRKRSCAHTHAVRLPLVGGSGGGLGTPALVAGLLGRLAGGGGPVRSIGVPGGAGGGSLGGEGTGGRAGDLPLAGEAGLDGGGANLVGTGDLGLLDVGAVLVLLGLGVAVEVQISHDVPLGLAGSEGAAQAEDLTGKHPPDETDGVATLVVGGDGNIDVLGGGVAVAKGLGGGRLADARFGACAGGQDSR